MSTLVEIESAVDRLPLEEKQELLRYLETSLVSNEHAIPSTTDSMSHDEWVKSLEKLRNSISTGKQSMSADEIISELREERL